MNTDADHTTIIRVLDDALRYAHDLIGTTDDAGAHTRVIEPLEDLPEIIQRAKFRAIMHRDGVLDRVLARDADRGVA